MILSGSQKPDGVTTNGHERPNESLNVTLRLSIETPPVLAELAKLMAENVSPELARLCSSFITSQLSGSSDGGGTDSEFHVAASPTTESVRSPDPTAGSGGGAVPFSPRPQVFRPFAGQSAAVSAPKTAPAAEIQPYEAPAPVPEFDRNEASMLKLLEKAPVALQRKRRRASEKQQTRHETSCRRFDQFFEWFTMERSTEALHGVLPSVEADSQLVEPQIRREFAVYWLERQKSAPTIKTYWQHCCMVWRAWGVIMPTLETEDIKKIQQKLGSKGAAVQSERRIPSRLELEKLCLAVNSARGPYATASPTFFLGYINFLALYGSRSRDIVAVTPAKMGLRKADLITDTRCPDEDVHATLGEDLHNPGGWIWVHVGKAAKKANDRLLLPLTEWARDWLVAFRDRSHHNVRIFPSAVSGREALSQAAMSNGWNQILEAADVPKNIRPSEGSGGVMAVRKCAANWWRLQVQEQLNDAALAQNVVQYVMHHSEATKDTASKHYLSVRAAVLPAMIKVLETAEPIPGPKDLRTPMVASYSVH